MAEKQVFVDKERMTEVWAAFLAKLALKADQTELADFVKADGVASAIAAALTEYAKSEEVAQSISTALEEYMTEQEVTQAIAQAIGEISGAGLTLKPEDRLPESGEENIIYLVPATNSKDKNARDEYIWFNNDWELIGSTAIDLDNYWSKDDLAPMTSEELSAILNPA